jgi:hypothetical protein
MPVESHKSVAEPPEDLVLWRYMDFSKYAWLLHAKALWFARADTLGDPFEGAMLLNPEGRARVREARREIQEKSGGSPITFQAANREALGRAFEELTEPSTPRLFGINSWHAAEGESAGLWRIYAPQGMGVAVRTTVGRLKRAMRDDPRKVYVGQVSYHDFNSESAGVENLLRMFLRKRRSFEHEREVRGLMFLQPGTQIVEPKPMGLAVAADLGELVEAVRVDPDAPSYLLDAVRGVTSALGLDAGLVSQSSLASDEPLFL